MTTAPSNPNTHTPKSGGLSLLDPVILGVLVIDGFICGVLSVIFLPSYLGTTPFPVSILVAAVVNLGLVIVARTVTTTGKAALPLAGWIAGFLLCMSGGPGGDVLVMSSPLTFLLLIGALAPATVYLFRVASTAFAPGMVSGQT